jgi:polyhydroxyalkanoate synthesis regulator phasin
MLVKVGRYRLTDATIDRDRDIVVPDGGDVTDFLKNPIILYNHRLPAIGRLENVSLENGAWYGDVYIDKDAKDENNANLVSRTKMGTLNMVSIRFQSSSSKDNELGGRTYEKWTLVEVSLVDIPSNPNAEKVKYFLTNNNSNMNLIDVINKFFGGTKDSTPQEAEELIKAYFAKGESEKVKETLKDYDGKLKAHLSEKLKGVTDQFTGFQETVKSLNEELETLKGQVAEMKGKSIKPEGEDFDGSDPGDDDDEEVFDLEKFHAKKYGK